MNAHRMAIMVSALLFGALCSRSPTSQAAANFSAVDCNVPLVDRVPAVEPVLLGQTPIPGAVIPVAGGTDSCKDASVQVIVFRRDMPVEGPLDVSSAYSADYWLAPHSIQGRWVLANFSAPDHTHVADVGTPASAPPPTFSERLQAFAVRLAPDERIVFEARRGTEVVRREVRVSSTAARPVLHDQVRWLRRFADAKAAATGTEGPLMIQRLNRNGTGWQTLKPKTLPAACHLALCRMGTKSNLHDLTKSDRVAYFTEP